MYNKINIPNTNKMISVKSYLGKQILKNYIKLYGGAVRNRNMSFYNNATDEQKRHRREEALRLAEIRRIRRQQEQIRQQIEHENELLREIKNTQNSQIQSNTQRRLYNFRMHNLNNGCPRLERHWKKRSNFTGKIPIMGPRGLRKSSCFQKNKALCEIDNNCIFVDNMCIKTKLYKSYQKKPERQRNDKNRLYKDRYISRQNDLRFAKLGFDQFRRYVFSNKLSDNTVE